MKRFKLQCCKKQISFVMAAVMAMAGLSVAPAVKTKADTAKQGTLIASYDFEGDDTDGWGPRGDESTELTTEASHTGKQSIKITNRTQSWNGVTCDVKDLLEDG